MTKVSPALDPGSTTIEVWIEATKPNPVLKPGMTVQVSMTQKTVKDALVVPTPAVFKNDEGASYVVIAGSDGPANAGEPIITSGGYALPDNTQIKIEAPGAEEKDAGDKTDKDDKDDKAADAAPKKDKE